MTEPINLSSPEEFATLDPWQQRTQSALWALLFLTGELALTVRILRNKLSERGGLLPEDEELINNTCVDPNQLASVYAHMERALQEKASKIHFALSNPTEASELTLAAIEDARKAQEEEEESKKIIPDYIKSTVVDESGEEGPEVRLRYIPNANV